MSAVCVCVLLKYLELLNTSLTLTFLTKHLLLAGFPSKSGLEKPKLPYDTYSNKF